MDRTSKLGQGADLRDYLAAERTLLAWIRTALSLMGFGFVVARFGIYLQQLQVVQHTPEARSYGLSLWFGTALIAVGVAVNVFSGWQHAQLVGELDRGGPTHSRRSTQSVAVAFFLALLGLGMAVYLISIRSSAQTHSGNSKDISLASTKDSGMINTPSNHSVDQTVQRLKQILQAKGITLFALVDHSGGAEEAGMKMRPTKLLIFGSPKGGTPMMLATPSIAIDLPLKILIWEDGQGKVWLSYNSSEYLQERHGLPQELLQNLAVVETLAGKAGE